MTQPGYQKREGKLEGLSTNLVQPRQLAISNQQEVPRKNGQVAHGGLLQMATGCLTV